MTQTPQPESPPGPEGPVALGRVRVDLAAERILGPEGQAALRPQSFAVLRHLIAHPGRLIPKEELMQAVWPGLAVTDDSLVQCIGEIRRALGPEGRSLIETVPRRGYRLAGVPAPADGPAPDGRRAPFGLRWGAAIAAALAAALLAAVAVGALRPGPEPAASPTPAIAVLPFVNMASQGGDYLGPGVAEDIIAMLARSQDVMVVARSSSFAYGGAPRDVREIGRELGVDYVLEGSVRREGDRLRITAQLEDVDTGRHIWAERYDRSGADPMAMIDEVAGKIIGAVVGEGGEVKRAQYRKAWGKDTAELGEYDYYLRGLDVYFNAETPEESERGGRIWAEGLARYPDSALLRVKLGWSHWTAAWEYWNGDVARHFAEADRLVTEALAMDNLSPETLRAAHWLNAFVMMRRSDFDAAVAEAEITASMAPYDGHMLRHLTDVLISSGRYDLAQEWLATAEPREPGNTLHYQRQYAWLYRLMGRYEDSAQLYEEFGPRNAYQHLSYAITLVRLGRLDAARSQVRAGLRSDPEMTLKLWRAGSFYSDPKVLDGEIAALAEAGLPA